MKNSILVLAIISIFSFAANATVWTLDNNTYSPGQFTSFTAVEAAAQPGDTILVSGSPNSYGAMTIKKNLKIFGAGINNPYGNPTTFSSVSFSYTTSTLATGSELSGIIFTSTCSFGSHPTYPLDSIVVERCKFNGAVRFSGSTNAAYSEIELNNCYFESNIEFRAGNYFTDINISNSLFNSSTIKYYSSQFPILSGVTVRNSIFLNNPSYSFNFVKELVVENCIFHNAEPTGCTDCTFNHNATYGNTNDTIPYGNGIGAGNLIGVDPMFVNYPTTGGNFEWAHDFHLQTGSSLINAATDASDIGLYGGAYPYEFGLNPAIPQMTELNMPNGSAVSLGGTLNVNFKAKKQD